MLGHLVFVEQKGRKPTVELERVGGLTFLRLAIPALPGAGEGSVRRRVTAAGRLLCRAEVRRVLVPPEFAHWNILREWGLSPVDAAPFCQMLASRLVLAVLAQKGVSPAEATVALRGNRVSRPFFQTAMELSPVVRALSVNAPNGGEALSTYLRSEYGVPVLEEGAGADADVVVEFSLLKGGAGERLLLYGKPDLCGVAVSVPALPPSAGFDPLTLAAVLWEAGEVSLSGFCCT